LNPKAIPEKIRGFKLSVILFMPPLGRSQIDEVSRKILAMQALKKAISMDGSLMLFAKTPILPQIIIEVINNMVYFIQQLLLVIT